jgi:hypothetical protein
MAAGVDDDRLAGHGVGAAHRDHHVGEVSLSVGFFSDGPRALSRSDMRVIALEAWTAPLTSADHSNSL